MINYIYELVAFLISVIAYARGDYKVMAVFIFASCIFGITGVFGDYIFKKTHKEVKNG